MSSGGNSGVSNGTAGAQGSLEQTNLQNAAVKNEERLNGLSARKQPIFSRSGHVTFESISKRAEFFLGKSVARIEHEMHKYGYKTARRASKHSTSKAKIIMTLNPSKDRNISQVQISPGSKRHGNVQYVKISTLDVGRIKIINASRSEYKTSGNENAKLIFRRDK